MADAQQAETLRRQGLQQREGLFKRQPGEKTGTQVSDPQGAQGNYGVMNEEAGPSEAWGAWGKVTGKRRGRGGDCRSAQA